MESKMAINQLHHFRFYNKEQFIKNLRTQYVYYIDIKNISNNMYPSMLKGEGRHQILSW